MKKNIAIISIGLIIIVCMYIAVQIFFNKKIRNYWEQPYTLNRSEILSNEIDLFELKRNIPEKSYENQVERDGYFYNVRLIKDGEYTILFDVWQNDKKATDKKIIEDMQCIASMFLKTEEQYKIKVSIRIISKNNSDTKDIYHGYIPNEIFNSCKVK